MTWSMTRSRLQWVRWEDLLSKIKQVVHDDPAWNEWIPPMPQSTSTKQHLHVPKGLLVGPSFNSDLDQLKKTNWRCSSCCSSLPTQHHVGTFAERITALLFCWYIQHFERFGRNCDRVVMNALFSTARWLERWTWRRIMQKMSCRKKISKFFSDFGANFCFSKDFVIRPIVFFTFGSVYFTFTDEN